MGVLAETKLTRRYGDMWVLRWRTYDMTEAEEETYRTKPEAEAAFDRVVEQEEKRMAGRR